MVSVIKRVWSPGNIGFTEAPHTKFLMNHQIFLAPKGVGQHVLIKDLKNLRWQADAFPCPNEVTENMCGRGKVLLGEGH